MLAEVRRKREKQETNQQQRQEYQQQRKQLQQRQQEGQENCRKQDGVTLQQLDKLTEVSNEITDDGSNNLVDNEKFYAEMMVSKFCGKTSVISQETSFISEHFPFFACRLK